MKHYFRKILVFCGAIAVLVLALGTFCTDQWIIKGTHHSHAGTRISHIEAAETMCHMAEESVVAISPKNSESTSETYLSGRSSEFIASNFAFNQNSDLLLTKTFLFSSFTLERHREVRYVVFRS